MSTPLPPSTPSPVSPTGRSEKRCPERSLSSRGGRTRVHFVVFDVSFLFFNMEVNSCMCVFRVSIRALSPFLRCVLHTLPPSLYLSANTHILNRESSGEIPPWHRKESMCRGFPYRTLHNEVLDACDLLMPTSEERRRT